MIRHVKEVKNVEFHPSGFGWMLHVDIERIGEVEVGFTINSQAFAKDALSENQLRDVIAEIERLIDKRGKGNVPGKWRKILHELKYGKEE